ncbi:acyl-ACP--UDP-N-acetylglucosamine O-acyltransferase [Aquamicrobium zhengzhouense]|uniref:Acyl-[acyl-carrier-protein]--UDP-N-acetylglucosamine O-acyltransferase n=1 Tax=Aquamicrobium zhengzhouense TaxID=2781738 RepID=A0ABS0S8A4_9HYPH|nr:acyl-ACP--UDP-N-acetylglucosamine O-acyltransferase [Aquamicrobium zhengzhouense]MBI1619528.1 acyl-ACP--UDP-N-acetylglucosamine O-acyltransferase [Aquamicrobium zhengzhouense]
MNSETFVHPSALVEAGAQLGAGVYVGPFCHVGPDVVLGDHVHLSNHVSVQGVTTIGSGTRIQAFATLGGLPQDTKHKGGPTTLTVGANCDIRESVTIHKGSDAGTGATVVGDNCFLLAYSHIAHDCIVGNNVTLTNGATLGGHCEVGEYVIIGGLTAVHQFVRIGRRAFLGGCSAVVGDVIPYAMAVGNRATLHGYNVVGLKRAGLSRSQLQAMRAAYRMLFSSEGTVAENAEAVRQAYSDIPQVVEILDFMTSRGKRHFVVPALDDRDNASDNDAD